MPRPIDTPSASPRLRRSTFPDFVMADCRVLDSLSLNSYCLALPLVLLAVIMKIPCRDHRSSESPVGPVFTHNDRSFCFKVLQAGRIEVRRHKLYVTVLSTPTIVLRGRRRQGSRGRRRIRGT